MLFLLLISPKNDKNTQISFFLIMKNYKKVHHARQHLTEPLCFKFTKDLKIQEIYWWTLKHLEYFILNTFWPLKSLLWSTIGPQIKHWESLTQPELSKPAPINPLLFMNILQCRKKWSMVLETSIKMLVCRHLSNITNTIAY